MDKKFQCIIRELKANSNPQNVQGMARFGINPKGALGVSIPLLRKMAKELGKDHNLALKLWDSKVHEARILAALVDDPGEVTVLQMEKWVAGFNSWDVCDQVCSNLFDKTPYAYEMAVQWSKRQEEFVKRAGYVLMAALSVHDKKAEDELFDGFLGLVENGADDDRNFVKKAVNWALRQIGKRNKSLNQQAVVLAKKLALDYSPSARWIGKDALRELTSAAVKKRLDVT